MTVQRLRTARKQHSSILAAENASQPDSLPDNRHCGCLSTLHGLSLVPIETRPLVVSLW